MSATTQEKAQVDQGFVKAIARRAEKEENRVLMSMEFPTLEDMEPDIPVWPLIDNVVDARLGPEDNEETERLYTLHTQQTLSVTGLEV